MTSPASLSAALAPFAPIVAALVRAPEVAAALRDVLGGESGGDALVPLAESGLERKGVRGLERRGLLRLVKIGRSLYLRRSELLAAFDALAAEQHAARVVQRDTKPGNDAAANYANVVALARGKRAAR